MYSNRTPCTYMTGTVEIVPPTYTYIVNSKYESAEHAHSFIEILYFESGQGVHTINGRTYPISPGDIYLINADVVHSYSIVKSEKDVCVKNCIFSADKFGVPANDFIKSCYYKFFKSKVPFETANFIYVSGDYKKDIFNLLQLIENELKLKQPQYENIVNNALKSILIKLFRSYEEKDNPHYLSTENITALEEAISFIKQNYMDNITLESLSKQLNYSRNYFNLIFKKYTSLTLRKYIQKTRCEAACDLLERTDMSVESICGAVGYSDAKQFFSIFKRIIGIQPRNYRKTISATKKEFST